MIDRLKNYLVVQDHTVILDETEMEFHFYLQNGYRIMYMAAYDKTGCQGIKIADIEVPLFESLDKLDGGRIHIDFANRRFADDTLGTDIEGYNEMSETNHVSVEINGEGQWYEYYEILMDFKKCQGSIFNIEYQLKIYEISKEPEELSPEDILLCKGNFFGVIDEIDPFE
ncbi:MAG: hypothetical protein JEZ07_04150 [Phycisphaerae bacterium]|nr:hypothetical protein [Phycisphaerae bacterium]